MNSRDDILEGSDYAPWRLELLGFEEFTALEVGDEPSRLSKAQLEYLASFGVLAPTSHNTVPQRFVLKPESGALELWLDRKFVLTASDVVGRQACVSIGAVLGNIVAAARCYGLDPQVEVVPTRREQVRPLELAPGERYVKLVELKFGTAAAGHEFDLEPLQAILHRKMVRSEFDESVKLSDEQLTRLQAVLKGHPDGLKMHLLTDSPTLFFLGKFQELADITVFNREDFARELGDWLLPNHSQGPLGMRGREFGLSDSMAERMHRGLKRELELLPDELGGIAKAGNIGIRSASAVVVLTVYEDTVENQIRAGWAFEDLVLLLEREGFRVSMHAGITEVEAPNLALRSRLRTMSRPTVVFRIGKPLYPQEGDRPHAARPSVQSLMISG